MKKIFGILLIATLVTLLMTVAAIPAMFWLDNWLQVLGAVTIYLALLGVMVMILARYLTAILDALIRKENRDNEKQ